jgi:hypothetical protein
VLGGKARVIGIVTKHCITLAVAIAEELMERDAAASVRRIVEVGPPGRMPLRHFAHARLLVLGYNGGHRHRRRECGDPIQRGLRTSAVSRGGPQYVLCSIVEPRLTGNVSPRRACGPRHTA